MKYGWTVIGAIAGTAWDNDFAMTNDGNGIWTSNDAFEMAAGNEFKVRQGLSWDNNFPADNFVVEADGTYFVQFDANTETVSLVTK